MESKGRIGVIVPHISSNTETELIDVIYRKAAEYGYDVLVISGVINYVDDMLEGIYCKGQTNIYDLILYGDFDGFIFEANIFCSEKQRKIILDLLKKRDIPTVVVNYEQPYFPVVSADETMLFYLTTEHLIKEHNCRKFYCIGGYKGHIPSEQRIYGFRKAMERDGVALVKFLRWLEEAVPTGNETELSIDKKLTQFRAEQAGFNGISFDTIAGYKEHAAIVHYEATPETDIPLKPEGLLLLDSGAQYLDGTTDITRTIALGPLTNEEKIDYTLVLKGHLQLQNAHFPAGTCGTQLDVLARSAMWKYGVNYLHGTGHGIGHFLCVHEGPHQIRMNHVPTPLEPGMIVTDEPGIYKANRHGIRIENTLLVVPAQETEFGKFYRFEPLTLCPIDKKAIATDMLSDEELAWINNYHQLVYNRLSPLVSKDEEIWLKEATNPIKR